MFIGEYAHNLDQKGRLSIPAKFRPLLQNGVVVTRGLDHCLFLYSKTEWAVLAAKVATLPLSSKKGRAFARLMLAGANDTELDGQGRILIPEYLRTYAGIAKQTVITGVYNRAEIWDATAWQKYKHLTEDASDDIAESLTTLGV